MSCDPEPGTVTEAGVTVNLEFELDTSPMVTAVPVGLITENDWAEADVEKDEKANVEGTVNPEFGNAPAFFVPFN